MRLLLGALCLSACGDSPRVNPSTQTNAVENTIDFGETIVGESKEEVWRLPGGNTNATLGNLSDPFTGVHRQRQRDDSLSSRCGRRFS